jgi:von Willebrand factor type A domain
MSGATKLFLSIITLPAFLHSGIAQAAPNSKPGMRSVIVNVFDAHGNSVRDLTKENFRVQLNGRPTAVLEARYGLAPRRIVVLLDTSGSMAGETSGGRWQVAREAVDNLLEQTSGNVPIAMLTFSGKIRDVFDFSQGRAAIAKWLREGSRQHPNLSYPAKTALFDAILAGVKLLSPVEPGDVVYAITDGGDNASQASAMQTKAALQRSDVRLFALLFAEPPNPSGGDIQSRDSLLSIVEESGGFTFGVAGHLKTFGTAWEDDYVDDKDTREKVRLSTQQLNVQINGFWTLELTTPPANQEARIKLDVVGADGRRRKDVGVAYCRVLLIAK